MVPLQSNIPRKLRELKDADTRNRQLRQEGNGTLTEQHPLGTFVKPIPGSGVTRTTPSASNVPRYG